VNFIALESPRKLRGGYYTPRPIVRQLVDWALAGKTRAEGKRKRVLEPAAGDGAFLRELEGAHVTALELDPTEAKKANAQVAEFLGWALGRLEPAFDAVVGNPPFVRYQYLPEMLQARAEQLHQRLGLPFTRHTNLWVPFVVASLALLREGGRLAMVVPAELLHVLHARAAREALVAQCARVEILEPQDTFDGTLQGVVLLRAEKGRGPAALVVGGSTWTPHAGKWTAALLDAETRERLADAAARVPRFLDLADVDVGIVTGANEFFLVDDLTVRTYGLARCARPMFGRSEHVPGVIYDRRTHAANRRRGLPTNFLELDARARRYLALGEAAGLPSRYKCRIRDPWWRVPSVWPAPVAMLKRSHQLPRLVWNRMRALSTDTAYRVQPHAGVSAEGLVASFVNSLTALSAELEGRHYGGGVLELVPSEIEQLLVPLSRDSDVKALDAAFRAGLPIEDILFMQDQRVLTPLGIEAAPLREAWRRLRDRRQRRLISF
jgi:adenine-specific DNA methylase